MSLALYVVVDTPEPGFDVYIDGMAVASAADDINALCDEAGLPWIDSFVGKERDALDDDADLDDEQAQDEQEDGDEERESTRNSASDQWFDAAEGVAWLQAVVDLIQEQPDALEDADAVLQDLADIQHVLEQAQAARLHWHFAWDF